MDFSREFSFLRLMNLMEVSEVMFGIRAPDWRGGEGSCNGFFSS